MLGLWKDGFAHTVSAGVSDEQPPTKCPLPLSVAALRGRQTVQVWLAHMSCCLLRLLPCEALALKGYVGAHMDGLPACSFMLRN